MKRQLSEWERIFATHVSDKKLLPKIYKELIQFKRKKQKTKNTKKHLI